MERLGSGWRLSASDEYFTHQVPLPHSMVGSSDPNWRERYWISIQDVRSQQFILSVGFGKYPNQDVLEGCVMAQHRLAQHNLRASRRLLSDVDRVTVGPMSLEVIEPLKTLRLRIEDNPSGMSADLLWHAAMPAMLEGRHFEINRARVTHDLVRYVQLGRIDGRLTIGDQRFALDVQSTWAERDHSWGLRPMAAIPGEPPPESVGWNFLAFCPIQFDDFCVHLYLFEEQAGRPTHLSASIVRKDGKHDDDPIEHVTHDFQWARDKAVLTLASGRIVFGMFSGERLEIDIEALTPRVYLRGGGYGVDQGRWKGAEHFEHEVWDLSDTQRLPDFAVSSSDHLIRATCGAKVGYGIIEYMVRRGHRAYSPALPPRRPRG